MQVGPNSNDGSSDETKEEAMWSQVCEYGRPLEAERGKKQILPYIFQREGGPADSLIWDFWPPQLRE